MRLRSGKRYRLSSGGYRPGIRDVVAAGVNAAVDLRRRYRSVGTQTMTTTRNRRGVRSGIGVTTQHDRRLVYKKRRMPRRKRKAWKKFTNKVNAVAEKDYGTRSIVFNRQTTTTNSSSNPTGQQQVLTFGLYGNQSSTEVQLNDLQYISKLENDTGTVSGDAGIAVKDSTLFYFKSGILDLTIRNVSTLTTQVTPTNITEINGNCKVELDLYEISISKQLYEKSQDNSTFSAYGSIESCITSMLNEETVINDLNITGEIKITPQSRGFTPFDATYALSRYGIKIWKKTKYFMPAGDTITYQVRDPKRHVMSRRGLSSIAGCNRPGITRFIFMVAKLVPGLTQGPNTEVGNAQLVLSYGMTRKYTYKVEGANDDRNEYVAQT